jgi:hypothetical protein
MTVVGKIDGSVAQPIPMVNSESINIVVKDYLDAVHAGIIVYIVVFVTTKYIGEH